MALDGMPLRAFPDLGLPSSTEIAAAIGNGNRLFIDGLITGGGRMGGGGDGAAGARGGPTGTAVSRARSQIMRLLNNSQFSFEVTDRDAHALSGMDIFSGMGGGLFPRARMQIRVSPVDPRNAGSRADFARFVTDGLRGEASVAGQLMSRLFDGGTGMGSGPLSSSTAADPASALLAVGPVPVLPLFPAANSGDGGASGAASAGSSQVSHAMRSLYTSIPRGLQAVPAGDGSISPEVQRLLLMERIPPDVPAAGSRASTGVNVMLLTPNATAGSTAAQAAALAASVLPYDMGARDSSRDEGRGGTAALVRTSAFTRSLLQDAQTHVPGGVGLGADVAAHDVSMAPRRFHDMMYGHARHPEHPLTTRQVCPSSSSPLH